MFLTSLEEPVKVYSIDNKDDDMETVNFIGITDKKEILDIWVNYLLREGYASDEIIVEGVEGTT